MDQLGMYFEELPTKFADGLNAVQKRIKEDFEVLP